MDTEFGALGIAAPQIEAAAMAATQLGRDGQRVAERMLPLRVYLVMVDHRGSGGSSGSPSRAGSFHGKGSVLQRSVPEGAAEPWY